MLGILAALLALIYFTVHQAYKVLAPRAALEALYRLKQIVAEEG